MNHFVELNTNFNSNKDIKNSYYKLCKIYHPDKNNGSNQKFIEIKEIYENLINNTDNTNNSDNNNDNDTIYKLFNMILKKYNITFVNKFLNNLYDDKKDLENDINKLNFNNFINKFDISNLNIYKNIYINLEDIYTQKDFYIVFYRKINQNLKKYQFKFNYDLYDKELEYYKYGDQLFLYTGNLIINIKLIIPNNYYIMDNYNLLIISDTLDIKLFDKYKLNFEKLINVKNNNNNEKILKFSDSGFLNKNNKRGKLYIKINNNL